MSVLDECAQPSMEVADMRFAFDEMDVGARWQREIRRGLEQVMAKEGHELVDDVEASELVFHGVDLAHPRPFRRRAKAVFVVGIVEGPAIDGPALAKTYPLLVRSISNLLIYGGDASQPWAVVTTPELGCATLTANREDDVWYRSLYDRIAPLATSHLVIDNIFDEDFPEELVQGTEVTDQIRRASRMLDQWHLFPAPYPVAEMLPEEDYRHLRRVFGIGGLSYGNISARHDQKRFWMSASGIDKGKIGVVGHDILLVKEYDRDRNAMRLSVRPGAKALRVSVDAVEHWGVYRDHPEIQAMIHIHAWMDGIVSTDVNYPCGTVEMGEAMSELFRRDPHPERTVIGLRNHGITATGPSLDDILDRLDGRVITTVPMT